MSMSIRHLTTAQLTSVLSSRGVTLPMTTQPISYYISLANELGISEVPLAQLAALRSQARSSTEDASNGKPANARPTLISCVFGGGAATSISGFSDRSDRIATHTSGANAQIDSISSRPTSSSMPARLEHLLLQRRVHVLHRALSAWQLNAQAATAFDTMYERLLVRYEEEAQLKHSIEELNGQLESTREESALEAAAAKEAEHARAIEALREGALEAAAAKEAEHARAIEALRQGALEAAAAKEAEHARVIEALRQDALEAAAAKEAEHARVIEALREGAAESAAAKEREHVRAIEDLREQLGSVQAGRLTAAADHFGLAALFIPI